MQDKGIVSNYLVGVILTGFGTLAVLAINMLFNNSDVDSKIKACEEAGKQIEKECWDQIGFKYFRTVDSTNTLFYRLTISYRFLPFTIIAIMTTLAAIALSMRTSANLAIVVGFGSAIVLGTVTLSLVKFTKNNLSGRRRALRSI